MVAPSLESGEQTGGSRFSFQKPAKTTTTQSTLPISLRSATARKGSPGKWLYGTGFSPKVLAWSRSKKIGCLPRSARRI